jgi:hypothetical protein
MALSSPSRINLLLSLWLSLLTVVTSRTQKVVPRQSLPHIPNRLLQATSSSKATNKKARKDCSPFSSPTECLPDLPTKDQITFYELANEDVVVGSGNKGDALLWMNTTWVDTHGDYAASSSGYCLALQPAPSMDLYCTQMLVFIDGGTLTFTGVTDGVGLHTARYTINGGSGWYAGHNGVVSSVVADNTTAPANAVFEHTILLY